MSDEREESIDSEFKKGDDAERDVVCKTPGSRMPTRFVGTLLASGSVRDGRLRRRMTLSIYKLHGEKLAAVWTYDSDWPAERHGANVGYIGSKPQVLASLDAHNPLPEGFGFPEGDRYVDKQRALRVRIGQMYEVLTVGTLGEAGIFATA